MSRCRIRITNSPKKKMSSLKEGRKRCGGLLAGVDPLGGDVVECHGLKGRQKKKGKWIRVRGDQEG